MKIGLFGGTFNPIHNGHLYAAKAVQRLFSLDRIFIIPSATPPHKSNMNLTTESHRMSMIKLAIAGCPGFEPCDVEIKRSGISYTIDTLKYFKAKYPISDQFFLIGSDAFSDITTWRNFQELFDLVHFVIIYRPIQGQISDNKILERAIHSISLGYEFDSGSSCYLHPIKKTIFCCSIDAQDVSSSQIRQCVYERKNIYGLVPKSVANHILTHKLYLEF